MNTLVNFSAMPLEGKKEVVVGSKVSQAENDALQLICDREDRSMSYVLRELALRGLVLYFTDGKLKTDDAEQEAISAGVRRAKGLPTKGVRVRPQDERPKIVDKLPVKKQRRTG